MFKTFKDLPFDGDVPRAIGILEQLAAWKRQFPDSDVTELDAPRIGNPWGYSFNGALLYEPAFEYDYHSSYFTRLLVGIENAVVLEIGGGFGGLAYHLLKRNRNVTYVGIDLPENVIIQFYYLSCAYPNRRIYLYGDQNGGIGDEAISEYDIILLPNFALPSIRASRVDLVANVRSLSEMSMETIIEYHRQIERLNPLFFFHENIAAERRDALHGIPSTDFPSLENYCLLMSCESRWPRYSRNSSYPCNENLYIRRNAIR